MDLSAKTVSGDQRIGAIREGQISVQSVSGDVRIGVRPGTRLRIDANSTSGDVSSELDVKDAPSEGSSEPKRGWRRRPSAATSRSPGPRPSLPEMRRPGGLWRHRDFLSLWGAETISQFGTQVSLLALPLVAILALEESSFRVAALTTAEFLPFLLFALPAGVWVDRLRRRPILILGDLGRARRARSRFRLRTGSAS